MNAQQLKNSILQMAVQGKLLPQDPNDEPASVLIERIRAEKEQLIKDKKIKKEKNPSFIFRGADNLPYENIGGEVRCIADEVPFEIPDSWEWVRLKNIVIINPRNSADENTDVGFMPMPLLSDGYSNNHSYEIRKWKDVKSGFTHFATDDIVIAKITPCFQNRKSAIITNLPNGIGAGTTELHVVRKFNNEINNFYLLWLFKTPYFIENGKKLFTGTAGQQRIGKEYIEELLVPFPPKCEQNRITEQLSKVLPFTESYNIAHSKIERLNTNFPEKLKKSILQWAVQGKLVPQDESDEPASVLLERIREEKAQLIKDKKIKKDKAENIIFKRDNSHYEKRGNEEVCIDDELPFEIPSSWEWVRLKTLLTVKGGKRIPKGQQLLDEPTSHIYIRVTDMKSHTLVTDKLKYISDETYDLIKNYTISKDDLYLTIAGTIGSVGIVPTIFDNMNLTENAVKLTYLSTNKYYLLNVLKSNLVQEQFIDKTNKVAQPKLAIERIQTTLIPLPPIEEQQRIVNAISEVEKLISTL